MHPPRLHPNQYDIVNIAVRLHELMSQTHERALQVVVRQYPDRIQWFCSCKDASTVWLII
jgi:hypothetical protein